MILSTPRISAIPMSALSKVEALTPKQLARTRSCGKTQLFHCFSPSLCLRLNNAGPLPSAQAWVDNLATRTGCVNISLYFLIYLFTHQPTDLGRAGEAMCMANNTLAERMTCFQKVHFFLYFFFNIEGFLRGRVWTVPNWIWEITCSSFEPPI